MRSSYIRPLAPAICYPHRLLSPHSDAPNPGVMACHICKRTQANPLYLPENNLIACIYLTRHAGSSGSRTHATELASQAHCTAAQSAY